MPTRICKVLLLEDRDIDALLIRQTISYAPSLQLVHRAKNGKEVLSYLQGAGVYADRKRYPMPHVLILNLEMPNRDGFHVLEWLRTSPLKSSLRAVALASIEHPAYLDEATELGARCCLPKPCEEAAIKEFAAKLEHWCDLAPPATTIV